MLKSYQKAEIENFPETDFLRKTRYFFLMKLMKLVSYVVNQNTKKNIFSVAEMRRQALARKYR